MKRKLVVVYDDSCKPKYDIKNIIGEKPFSKIIYKRKSLLDRVKEKIEEYPMILDELLISDLYNVEKYIKTFNGISDEVNIVHIFLDHIVQDDDEMYILIEKCTFLKENAFVGKDGIVAAVVFSNVKNYIQYLKEAEKKKDTRKVLSDKEFDIIKSDALANINNVNNFLSYMTGGFEARFFNALTGDDYTVVKTSANKKKIKAEYTFYHLIPDDMKMWFVLPYNYVETEEMASYTMERLHMPDVAIRWVHGAISPEEFSLLLEKIFQFVNTRRKKDVSQEEYDEICNTLYVKKLLERVEDLKNTEWFERFDKYIANSTDYVSFDAIIEKYLSIYDEVKHELYQSSKSVIGHGDLCFSNMLYNKDTMTLKLIDTKGAIEESEIWTNPYYDLAKLSHSICGCYDFFNSGLYEVSLNEQMKFTLTVDFDNSVYKQMFKEYLEKNGVSYKLVRTLEASLFLSMLPLHMDKPQKVFAFILNAVNILEEIENV